MEDPLTCSCCAPDLDVEACLCPGGISGKFIQPCLLLLLSQQDSYGYELVDRLKDLGAPSDASAVYRALRRMEQEGLVVSQWDTAGPGPAKRVYQLTAEGEDLLHTWTVTIRRDKETLEQFLRLYHRRFHERG
jgi:poly-beta-hydroxybutyrate-responsive repressor